jgi:hypothetical protein
VKFTNNKTGWKLASSIGGTVLGERGSRIILDDPNSTSDIESDATRYRTELFFTEVLPDRLGNLEEDAIVIIMQRLHESDVSGIALTREMGYTHLNVLRVSTLARFVREGRFTEREAALVRGSAALPGFRGHIYATLRWLENLSPGATRRFFGDRRKGWKRNVAPAHEAVRVAPRMVKLRVRREWARGLPPPPSKFRCTAISKSTRQRCRHWAMLKPDGNGGRYPTCGGRGGHGASGGRYGRLAWQTRMDWNGREFVERKVQVSRGGPAARKQRNIARGELKRRERAERKWAALGQDHPSLKDSATSLEAEFRGGSVPRPRAKPLYEA